MRVTLDTNCIYILDQDREPGASTLTRQNAAAIRALTALHEAGRITMRLVASSASENQRGGAPLTNFSQFMDRLHDLGLARLEILNPPVYLDFSFFDHCVFASDTTVALERRVRAVLFPNLPMTYGEYCALYGIDPTVTPIDRRWRKRLCDIQVVWCHLHYGGNLLVTTDQEDMLRRRGKLIALGAGEVLHPIEAAARLGA